MQCVLDFMKAAIYKIIIKKKYLEERIKDCFEMVLWTELGSKIKIHYSKK